MIKTLKQIIHMQATLWVNAFCYYFKRMWLVGKWMPDSIYSCYRCKKVLSILAVIVRQFIELCGKVLYLCLVVAFPLVASGTVTQSEGQAFAAMVQILFFLNCIIGAFGESRIFAVTRDKITCIKYLHMNARTYTQGLLAFKYVPFFLFYLLCLLVASRLLGATLLQGFFLWLMLLSFRMIGEAFQLLVFDRTGKVISRGMLYNWVAIGIGLVGAYLPFALGGNWQFGTFLMHPVCVAAYTILGAVSLWFITVGYRGYEEKLHRSIDINFLLSTLLKSSSSAAFKDIEMKEADATVSQAERAKLEHLKGYSYLNALFFVRHRRQLIKPLYYRLAAVAGVLAVGVVVLITNPSLSLRFSDNITAVLLPSLVFIMYCMTVADKACRSMFYNCDKDMLRFSYYRQPGVILKNFKIRLVRVMLYNSITAGAICLAVLALCLLCGVSVFSLDMLLFSLTIFLLSALFTVHHLGLYYIFQPYSESLQMKNPFYAVINTVMYFLCFLCLEINTGGMAFTMSVLIFTVLYTAVVLVLVYRLAPKTFRIK